MTDRRAIINIKPEGDHAVKFETSTTVSQLPIQIFRFPLTKQEQARLFRLRKTDPIGAALISDLSKVEGIATAEVPMVHEVHITLNKTHFWEDLAVQNAIIPLLKLAVGRSLETDAEHVTIATLG